MSPPGGPAIAERTAERTVATPGGVAVVASNVHGRGVAATRRFHVDEVIEVCPVLVCGAEDTGHLEWTSLRGYYFEWADDGVALALGYGSLYNHSWTPNAAYEEDHDAGVIRYIALRPIEAGEEITVNYLGGPDGRGELWFDAGPPPEAARRSQNGQRRPTTTGSRRGPHSKNVGTFS